MSDDAPKKSAKEDSTPKKVAKIKITQSGTAARGFVFARGKVVEGVSIDHAEHLEKAGKAQIIDITTP